MQKPLGEKLDQFPIAIKKFRRENEFIKERESLDRIRCLNNAHLIGYVAFCEAALCIMFPWAQGGSLHDFWQRERGGEAGPELVLWSLRQMRGLAHGLEGLHGLNCRHGDLKPANILHFAHAGGGIGTLKIADLGTAKIHKQCTVLRQEATATTALTVAYQAPEVSQPDPNKARSRTYDSWSMGCIFLEFVIWLLYSAPALNCFKGHRDQDTHSFYQLTYSASGERNVPEKHPAVEAAMACLREDARCRGTALEEVVNLVNENLLVIKPKMRFVAADLRKRLAEIVERAERGELELIKAVDPPVTTPAIFAFQPPVWDSQHTTLVSPTTPTWGSQNSTLVAPTEADWDSQHPKLAPPTTPIWGSQDPTLNYQAVPDWASPRLKRKASLPGSDTLDNERPPLKRLRGDTLDNGRLVIRPRRLVRR